MKRTTTMLSLVKVTTALKLLIEPITTSEILTIKDKEFYETINNVNAAIQKIDDLRTTLKKLENN